jgi:hypothetical protein
MGAPPQSALTAEQKLEREFPGLVGTAFRIVSPKDKRYNCHAYAVRDVDRWHDHNRVSPLQWPHGVSTAGDIESYKARYHHYGFDESDGVYDAGFEQVAVFGAKDDSVLHSARQVDANRWVSKLGKGQDIEHDLHALQGKLYGEVLFYMKKRTRESTPDPTKA